MGVARDLTSGKDVFPVALQIVRRLHEGGVRLTAGSDVGMPWITPGLSLHRELELLVQAGIDEADVIVMATRNGAEGLSLEDQARNRRSREAGRPGRALGGSAVGHPQNPFVDRRLQGWRTRVSGHGTLKRVLMVTSGSTRRFACASGEGRQESPLLCPNELRD